jgi:hypothetical protein
LSYTQWLASEIMVSLTHHKFDFGSPIITANREK